MEAQRASHHQKEVEPPERLKSLRRFPSSQPDYRPVPVRLRLWGLGASGLALIATEADSAPATLGLNVTPILHDEPPASVASQGVMAAAVTEKSAGGRIHAVLSRPIRISDRREKSASFQTNTP